MTDSSDSTQETQPFIAHLIELRDRLLRMVLGVLLVLVLLVPFSNNIYHFIALPLIDLGVKMQVIDPIGSFFVPFKLTLMTAVFVSVPWILYQFWAFVAPGLYQHEKRLMMPLLASSTVLFYLGVAFAYVVVFELIFRFMVSVTPEGATMDTDIGKYLDFVITIFFAFGFAFEVPIATILLVVTGVTSPEKLATKRPYVIVGAFIVGMLLTPPDIISQTLLAVPMWLLFEAGLFFSRFFLKVRKKEEDASPEPDGVPTPLSDDKPSPALEEPPRYVPLTDEEMEAELDVIEAEEDHDTDNPVPSPEAIEDNLKQIHELRMAGDGSLARDLLYEVIQYGDAKQVEVARNILRQMDED